MHAGFVQVLEKIYMSWNRMSILNSWCELINSLKAKMFLHYDFHQVHQQSNKKWILYIMVYLHYSDLFFTVSSLYPVLLSSSLSIRARGQLPTTTSAVVYTMTSPNTWPPKTFPSASLMLICRWPPADSVPTKETISKCPS